MNQIYTDIIDFLKSGQPVAMARIIQQTGSAPRSVGTACLILADGTIKGTVGGGSLEYQVIQKAGEVLETRRSALLEFRLTGKEVAESQMLCGGTTDVYLEPLIPQDSAAIDLFAQVRDMLYAGRRGVLVTRIAAGTAAGKTDVRALVKADGTTAGGLLEGIYGRGLEHKDLLACRQAGTRKIRAGTRHQRLFLEPLRPESVLFLFGAGHVSTFVAPLAATAGFRVVVIDDRAEFANAQRFPRADSILVSTVAEAFEQLDINAAAFVAIITRGHLQDREVLAAALQKRPAYIGMIGSLRKRNLIYQSLVEAGFSAEGLRQVHSPVGLDIGAETPEEIAVSIVAELIHVRAVGPVAKKLFEIEGPA